MKLEEITLFSHLVARPESELFSLAGASR